MGLKPYAKQLGQTVPWELMVGTRGTADGLYDHHSGPGCRYGMEPASKGGRAFLCKDGMGWFVELRARESLVQPATFVSMGLPPAETEILAAAVIGTEGGASADLIG